jgi:glycerol-3-phosphate dehydrogenase
MAAQVVDRITQRDGREAECRTDDIPLGMAARPDDLETSVDLPEGATDQLAFRYGHAARAVLDVCEERSELAERIVPGHPDLLAEVVIAARREQACSVADVLVRRTRLGLVAAAELREPDRALAVARLLGEELGWSESRVATEHEEWTRVAAAEGLDSARTPAQ